MELKKKPIVLRFDPVVERGSFLSDTVNTVFKILVKGDIS